MWERPLEETELDTGIWEAYSLAAGVFGIRKITPIERALPLSTGDTGLSGYSESLITHRP